MIATTGNWNRDSMLRQAIEAARAENGPTDFESVKARLPADFDLDESEHRDFSAEHVAVKLDVAEPPPAPVESGEPITGTLAAVETPDTMQPAPVHSNEQEAEQALRAAEVELSEARANVVACDRRAHHARGRLADAITRWQSGFVKLTQEQLARDYCRSEQAQRAARARGEIPSYGTDGRPANSKIDRMNFFGRGSADETGAGRGYRRALVEGRPVFGAEHRGRKIPSER